VCGTNRKLFLLPVVRWALLWTATGCLKKELSVRLLSPILTKPVRLFIVYVVKFINSIMQITDYCGLVGLKV
jgi:hypothetical protein